MTRREQVLFDKAIHQLQQAVVHMPLDMNPEDAFISAKSCVKSDLLLLVDLLDKVDYDYFKPFMNIPLTPPANRL